MKLRSWCKRQADKSVQTDSLAPGKGYLPHTQRRRRCSQASRYRIHHAERRQQPKRFRERGNFELGSLLSCHELNPNVAVMGMGHPEALEVRTRRTGRNLCAEWGWSYILFGKRHLHQSLRRNRWLGTRKECHSVIRSGEE